MELLTRGESTDFVEFSIGSDDQDDNEEEFKKFTLEDYDDDDPLGILGNDLTDKIQQTLDRDDDEDDNDDDNDDNDDNEREDKGFKFEEKDGVDVSLNPGNPQDDCLMDNIPLDNDEGESPILNDVVATDDDDDASPTLDGSTRTDSNTQSAAAVVSKSDVSSALRKMTVATKEDPLSAAAAATSTWNASMSGSNPSIAQNYAPSNANDATNGTYQSGGMSGNVVDANHVTVSYPPQSASSSSFVQNATHARSNDGFVPPPMTNAMPLFHHGNTTNYSSSVDINNYSSSKSSGMASFVSKTHSLSSTFSSFASKVQDVVSNAANSAAIHGMNIHASAPSKKMNAVYGHSSPPPLSAPMSGPMSVGGTVVGGDSGNIPGMSSLGMRSADGNLEQKASHGVTGTAVPLGIAGGNGDAIDKDGDRAIGMGMVASKEDVMGSGTTGVYKNEFQSMDNSKKL
jgi:hypothetical protein